MYKLLLPLVSFFTFTAVTAQNTVGLLSYDPTQTFEGYNLMFPHDQPNVFLLDNCGEIVHSWEDEENFRPGNTVYLREDGSLIKAKRDAMVVNDAIWAGGGGETIEIRDWENNLTWSYTLNDSLRRLHHDVAPMPNGNILMVAWELKTEEEALEAGRDPAKLAQGKLWPDYIIEVNPTTDEIVWEWHAWDHLVQDFDSTKSNYGVVSENPRRIDLNYDTSEGDPDWMHSNAIDYNPFLDQIMLCVPTFNEIWIIDHTTTTAEAASSRGGFSGRGGDLMFRWGNPAAYQRGTEEDQQLFYPHDAHWVDDFIDVSLPAYDKIAVFNNRVGENYSTVNLIQPNWNMYGWIYISISGTYLPTTFDQTITHPDTTQLFSTGLSSVQFLGNGNTLICSGRFGYSFELTPDNEIVWEYKTPFQGQNRATQGDSLGLNDNLTFRLDRYPIDFDAFTGRELSSKGWIELEPNTTFCDQITTNLPLGIPPSAIRTFPNPAQDFITGRMGRD